MRPTLAVALAVLAAALTAAPAHAGFTRCTDDHPFFIAIYQQGIPCEYTHNVLSTWNAHRDPCHTHLHCTFTYRHHTGNPVYHLECTNSHKVDHRDRHYIYLACFSADRKHDIRSRYYPRGDYSPDR